MARSAMLTTLVITLAASASASASSSERMSSGDLAGRLFSRLVSRRVAASSAVASSAASQLHARVAAELLKVPVIALADSFEGGPDESKWKYQGAQLAADGEVGDHGYKYGYEATGALWFNGASAGLPTHRTVMKLTGGEGTTVSVKLQKNEKCANHYLMLSNSPDAAWTGWAPDENAIKFGWDCDNKVLRGAEGVVESVACTRLKPYTLKLSIGANNSLSLSDDGGCKTLTLPANMTDARADVLGAPFYLYIGADQRTPGVKSRFTNVVVKQPVFEKKVPTPFTPLPLSDASLWGGKLRVWLDDELNNTNTKNWKYPATKGSGYTYGFGADVTTKVAADGVTKEEVRGPGHMWFTGSQVGKVPVRSVKSFSVPFAVTASLKKTDACSSHFMVLTHNPNYKFTWGSQANTIKLLWNCNSK